MSATPRVDGHVHLFDPQALPYPWVRDTPLDRRFDADDLVRADGDVAEWVVVQADTTPEHAVDEVRWVTEQLGGRGLLGVVAHADVGLGAAVDAQLDELLGSGPVVGIRRLLQDEPAGVTLVPGFDGGLARLTARDLPFDVCVRSHQLGEVVGLVGRHPEQHFVLDHLGKPAVGDPDAFAPWHRAITVLAAHPHVVVKLSGLASELVAGATLADATPYVDAALELFGPSRCLYGGDWPVVTLASSVTAWRDVVESRLAGLDDDARAQVMGGTARRVYRRR